MASITIRNLDGPLKGRLKVRAAQHGRSMEAEAREILRTTLAQSETPARNLAEAVRERLSALGGVDLDPPPREPIRQPPDLSE
jgi:plasmid stability protein